MAFAAISTFNSNSHYLALASASEPSPTPTFEPPAGKISGNDGAVAPDLLHDPDTGESIGQNGNRNNFIYEPLIHGQSPFFSGIGNFSANGINSVENAAVNTGHWLSSTSGNIADAASTAWDNKTVQDATKGAVIAGGFVATVLTFGAFS